jgi:hypothetical protein
MYEEGRSFQTEQQRNPFRTGVEVGACNMICKKKADGDHVLSRHMQKAGSFQTEKQSKEFVPHDGAMKIPCRLTA